MEKTKNNEIKQILNNDNQVNQANNENNTKTNLVEKSNTNNSNSNNQEKKAKNSKSQKKTDPKNFVWFKDLNKAFNENEKIHHTRLTTYNKINENTKGWVRFTPLGGLDEIGGNCAVLETENSAIIIDCGMSFPSEDMHGVDILIPDFSYLREIRHKIKGLIITHGHEDHIGAVPYLFKYW
jgi:ribonuclease J